jgi:hypothetical protein
LTPRARDGINCFHGDALEFGCAKVLARCEAIDMTRSGRAGPFDDALQFG